MLIDLHVHTRLSPGSDIDAPAAIEKAAAEGLDGICFTDLDTTEGLRAVASLREGAPIAVFAGVELSTDHGRLLCFFPEPAKVPALDVLLGPSEADRPVREVLRAVRAAGAAVVAAHPYRRDLDKPMGDFIFTLDGLAAVEGYAGGCPAMANEHAIEAADRLGLPCVGGSGAHESVDVIGGAATLFRDEVKDERGLVEALLTGQVWAVAIGSELRFAGDQRPPRRERRGRRPHGRRARGR